VGAVDRKKRKQPREKFRLQEDVRSNLSRRKIKGKAPEQGLNHNQKGGSQTDYTCPLYEFSGGEATGLGDQWEIENEREKTSSVQVIKDRKKT